ncbi:MAG TPA: periplasmic heavy metal sensor [Candidatus Omnitrophota bacterium]|nr:periplasmic heavy metal sensor [Candidatus Omnitrophota bacterium]
MKRSMRFVKCGSIAAAGVCFLAATACAQLPDPDQSKREQKWNARFAGISAELGLSAEQQQAMASQHSQERKQSYELRQKTKAVRLQITEELNKEKTDTAKVNALVAELKALTGQRIDQQIQGIMELKKILTPEQFNALNEKRRQDGSRRKRGGRHE